ncbi:hypothetical protein J6590_104015 [Homalodisca vitripennis]|nr:hypothetical protein J6590_104015 [Homalodisca vitripennis]
MLGGAVTISFRHDAHPLIALYDCNVLLTENSLFSRFYVAGAAPEASLFLSVRILVPHAHSPPPAVHFGLKLSEQHSLCDYSERGFILLYTAK